MQLEKFLDNLEDIILKLKNKELYNDLLDIKKKIKSLVVYIDPEVANTIGLSNIKYLKIITKENDLKNYLEFNSYLDIAVLENNNFKEFFEKYKENFKNFFKVNKDTDIIKLKNYLESINNNYEKEYKNILLKFLEKTKNFIKINIEKKEKELEILKYLLDILNNLKDYLLNFYLNEIDLTLENLYNLLINEFGEFLESVKSKNVLMDKKQVLDKLKLEMDHIKPILYQKCNLIFGEETLQKALDNFKRNYFSNNKSDKVKGLRSFSKDYINKYIDFLKNKLKQEFEEGKKFFYSECEKFLKNLYFFLKYRFDNLKILLGLSITFFLLAVSFLFSSYRDVSLIFFLLAIFTFSLFLVAYFFFNFFIKRSFFFYLRRKMVKFKSKLIEFFNDIIEKVFEDISKYIEKDIKRLEKEKEELVAILDFLLNIENNFFESKLK